jgi:hypothetical protein
MLDTDTSATFNHGFNLSAGELAALYPIINFYQTATNGASSVGLSFTTGTAFPNTFTITKLSLTGSGGTWVVQAFRPMSLFR